MTQNMVPDQNNNGEIRIQNRSDGRVDIYRNGVRIGSFTREQAEKIYENLRYHFEEKGVNTHSIFYLQPDGAILTVTPLPENEE